MYVNTNLIRIHLYFIKTHKKYIEFYVVLVNYIKFYHLKNINKINIIT